MLTRKLSQYNLHLILINLHGKRLNFLNQVNSYWQASIQVHPPCQMKMRSHLLSSGQRISTAMQPRHKLLCAANGNISQPKKSQMSIFLIQMDKISNSNLYYFFLNTATARFLQCIQEVFTAPTLSRKKHDTVLRVYFYSWIDHCKKDNEISTQRLGMAPIMVYTQ